MSNGMGSFQGMPELIPHPRLPCRHPTRPRSRQSPAGSGRGKRIAVDWSLRQLRTSWTGQSVSSPHSCSPQRRSAALLRQRAVRVQRGWAEPGCVFPEHPPSDGTFGSGSVCHGTEPGKRPGKREILQKLQRGHSKVLGSTREVSAPCGWASFVHPPDLAQPAAMPPGYRREELIFRPQTCLRLAAEKSER